jgi:hypothetical protein
MRLKPPVPEQDDLISTIRHLDRGPKGRAERSTVSDMPLLVDVRSLRSAGRDDVIYERAAVIDTNLTPRLHRGDENEGWGI